MAPKKPASLDDVVTNDAAAIAVMKEEAKRPGKMYCKAQLEFRDNPGSILNFIYEGQHYKIQDGEIVELPLAMVQDLNSNCAVVKRRRKKEFGNYQRTLQKERRLSFDIIEKFEKVG